MYKKRKSIITGAFTDKAALKIAQGITRLHKGFGNSMNKLTRNYSPRTWKLLIVVFAGVWGIVSIRCIISAFGDQVTKLPKTTMHFITRPVHADSLVLLEHIYEQRKKNEDE